VAHALANALARVVDACVDALVWSGWRRLWESWQALGLPQFLRSPELRTDPKFANFSVLRAWWWTKIASNLRCFSRADR